MHCCLPCALQEGFWAAVCSVISREAKAWQINFFFQNKDSGERDNKQLREDDEEETVKHK